jgi:hypothetical protein
VVFYTAEIYLFRALSRAANKKLKEIIAMGQIPAIRGERY